MDAFLDPESAGQIHCLEPAGAGQGKGRQKWRMKRGRSEKRCKSTRNVDEINRQLRAWRKDAKWRGVMSTSC
jgi:hypothetical protein